MREGNDLPTGWTRATPQELSSQERYSLGIGPFGSDLKISDYRETGVPLVFVRNIRSRNFSETKFISSQKAEALRAHLVLPGDVLVTKMGDPPGDSASYPLSSEPAVVTADCIRWRINPEAGDGAFFVYAVQSPWVKKQIQAETKGVAQKKVSLARFSRIEFPVPTPPEQRRIVESLDSYFTRLDAAEQALLRAQANLKRYRASVLKAAVEGRLVPTEAELARAEKREYEPASVLLARVLAEKKLRWEKEERAKLKAKGISPKGEGWKAKYVEPAGPDTAELPELPEGWCWATVGQLADVGTGATPKRGEAQYYEGGKVPWVTSGAVNGRVVRSADEYVTEAALRETNLTVYPAGTLLLAMYGEGKTRGMVAELVIEAATNQALAALVFLGEAASTKAWTSLFLDHNYEAIRRRSSGGVQPNLNLGLVRSLVIPLPPSPTQKLILEKVREALSGIENSVGVVESNLARITRLRQSILKWAFEGRLVDQDPNDEPASELLARIRAQRAGESAQQSPKPRRRKGAPS